MCTYVIIIMCCDKHHKTIMQTFHILELKAIIRILKYDAPWDSWSFTKCTTITIIYLFTLLNLRSLHTCTDIVLSLCVTYVVPCQKFIIQLWELALKYAHRNIALICSVEVVGQFGHRYMDMDVYHNTPDNMKSE